MMMITVSVKAVLNPSAYFINHCLAVLCNFLGGVLALWERDISSERIG